MKKLQALKSKYRLSRFIFEDIVFLANILKNDGMSIDVIKFKQEKSKVYNI